MSFCYRRKIVMGDVDYARVLYYPRFLNICHEAFEAFTEERFGLPYARLFAERNIGFPTVAVAADYHRPVPYGATLTVGIEVEKIGTSSLVLRYEARLEDDSVAATARGTTVCVAMDTFEPLEIPPDLRTGLQG